METDAGKEKGIRGDDTLTPLHCANVPGIAGVPSAPVCRQALHPLRPLARAPGLLLRTRCLPCSCPCPCPSNRPPDGPQGALAGCPRQNNYGKHFANIFAKLLPRTYPTAAQARLMRRSSLQWCIHHNNTT